MNVYIDDCEVLSGKMVIRKVIYDGRRDKVIFKYVIEEGVFFVYDVVLNLCIFV